MIESVIYAPFPTHRLASIALRAISVDSELSPLVQRTFTLSKEHEISDGDRKEGSNEPQEKESVRLESPAAISGLNDTHESEESKPILKTEYRASTNRMLRVAVNGFMESLILVISVMMKLDEDVLEAKTQNDIC